MTSPLRYFVQRRAHGRCEYCHLPDTALPMSLFHVEHIIALQHDGLSIRANLCWSCHRCNLKKGPNLSGIDPVTGTIVPLFHPRRQHWNRHFRWDGVVLKGLTKCGRATIRLLEINDLQRIQLRLTLQNE